MLDKMPLLIVILAMVFVITSLMAFVAMDKITAPEQSEVKKQAAANVVINIRAPEAENSVSEDILDGE